MSSLENLKNKAIQGMMWSSIGSLIFQVIRTLTQIVLARFLWPEAFGYLAIVMAFISISQYLIENGLTMHLIRSPQIDESLSSTIFYSNVGFSLIISLLLILYAPFLARNYESVDLSWMLQLLALSLVFMALGSVHKALLTRNIQFKGQVFVNLISATLAGIVAISLAILKFGIVALVVYNLLYQFLQWILITRIYSFKPIHRFNRKQFREAISFSWKLMLSGLINTIYENIFNLIMGGIYNLTSLGFYSNALKIRDGAAQTLTDSIQKVSYPVLSSIQDDLAKFKESTKVILKLSVYIIYPILFGLAALSEPLIKIVFGDLWLGMIPIMQILAMNGLLIPLHKVNLNILTSLGRSDLYLKLEFIKKAIAFTTLGFGFMLHWDLTLILWLLFFNATLGWMVNAHYSKNLINYGFLEQLEDISKTIIGSLMMAGVVWGTSQWITSWTYLMLIVVLGIMTYLLASILFIQTEFKTLWSIGLGYTKRFRIKR